MIYVAHRENLGRSVALQRPRGRGGRRGFGAAIPEHITPEFVRDELPVAAQLFPPTSITRKVEPMSSAAISVKINANIGNSAVTSSVEEEVEKDGVGDPLGRRLRQ
jgi:phosphomethylpyrimidine synthase